MKNNIRLSVSVLLFCACFGRLYAQQDLLFSQAQPTISMDFQDASLKDILKIFSIQSGLNFIASEGVQDRQITLFMDNVPVQEAMDKIFKANNLSYELDDEASIFIVKDWGKPEIETITKVFTLKYRSVPSARVESEKNELLKTSVLAGADIISSLRQVISANGKINEDPKTNSLIITDIPSRFAGIEKVIASLDLPQLQVMLDVEILDVSKNIVDKMGFEFGENPFTLNLHDSKFYLGSMATRGIAGALTMGHTFAQALSFLKTQTDTKYLARPRLLTLNNESAEISITKDEVVEVTPTTSTFTPAGGGTPYPVITGVEFKRASDFALIAKGIGVTLRVTPQINPETGEITMVINPKVSTSSESPRASAFKYVINNVPYSASAAEPEIRETKSIVKVRDGETVILGGLIHSEKQLIRKKLPILGDIPILGLLFRQKDQPKDTERELIVFITPRIVKDVLTGTAYTKKSVLPGREQSVSLATDRLSAISKSLDTFEKAK
jgi:type IV pilus assembly protein PilQ